MALGSGLKVTAQTGSVTPSSPPTPQVSSPTPIYDWTTLAGHPTTGYADGPAEEALFNSPRGIAVDSNDNTYVADTANHVIRKISPQGMVTTLAGSAGNPGSADGTVSVARFAFPESVAVDAAGNIYVADTENYTVRKITPEGVVTTLAGKAGESGDAVGPLDEARFSRITHLVSDKLGNVYIGNRRITSSGVEEVSFNFDDPVFSKDGRPTGEVRIMRMTVDADGDYYLAVKLKDSNDAAGNGSYDINRIVKLNTDGSYSMLASSELSDEKPYFSTSVNTIHMTNDAFGNVYYVTELVSSIIEYRVYRISPDGTVVDAAWQNARRGGYADKPTGLSADSHGNLLHTASSDDVIFKTENSELQVLAGTLWSTRGEDGAWSVARFANISSLGVDQDGEIIIGDSVSSYNVHYYANATVRKVSTSGEASLLYTSPSSERVSWVPAGVAVDVSNNVYLTTTTNGSPKLTKITSDGMVSSLDPGSVRNPRFVATTSEGALLVSELTRISRRSTSGGWTILAGADEVYEIKDGTGTAAHFYNITALTIASNGDIYVLDDASARTGEKAVFIRKIDHDLVVTTLTDNLIKSDGTKPQSMTRDAKGDFLLTYSDDTIRLLTADKTEHIIGGQSGLSGTRDGQGNEARFYAPAKIVTDENNNAYVSDNAGTIIRKGEYGGAINTITEQPESITVTAGATAEFSVTAIGTPAPTYQWHFENNPISDATTDTLTISNTQTSHAGIYTVTVSNSFGTVTSTEAILTVTTSTTPPINNSGGDNSGNSSGDSGDTSGSGNNSNTGGSNSSSNGGSSGNGNNSTGSSSATTSNRGSSGGGGGAPSAWFLLTLFGTTLAKLYQRKN